MMKTGYGCKKTVAVMVGYNYDNKYTFVMRMISVYDKQQKRNV